MGKFIAFEGCLGAGKTTLASELPKYANVRPLIEDVNGHPFIRDFYRNKEAYALETELVFPIMHFHQLSEAAREGLFDGNVVSDFCMEKDLIFPLVTLKKENDRRIFKTLWSSLRKRVRTPDLVVFLDAPTEFLLKRVQQRGRDYENPITFEYLDEVNKEYKRFMKDDYDKSEVLILDASKLAKRTVADSVSDVARIIQRKMDLA